MSSSLSVSISGTSYQILSFSIKNRVNERTQFDLVAVDTTNNAVFSKGEKIIVTDTNLGTLFQGFINIAQPLHIIPQPYTYWQINCVDYHYVADKRTVNTAYTNQYAGYIALDMLQSTLAAEGVTSQYAIQHTTTQSDFATGTLATTTSTSNVGDGDLELSSSASVSASYLKQADWTSGGGVFSNLQANAGGDVSLIGTSRNWQDGKKSGQTLYGNGSPSDSASNGAYILNCSAASATISRLDFAGTVTNGTVLCDITLNNSTVLPGFTWRQTVWNNVDDYAYAVEFSTGKIDIRVGGNGSGSGNSSLASHTFSPTLSTGTYTVKVVINGSSFTASVNGTQYVSTSDSTYSGAGYIALRNRNPHGNGSNAQQFANFAVTTTTSGTWTGPSTSINAITSIASTIVSWDTTLSQGGTITVQTSTNGGSTYQAATNGGPIIGLTKGSSGAGLNVRIKITLTATTGALPNIRLLAWSVVAGYLTPGTRSTAPLGIDTMVRANQSGWGTAFDGQTYSKVGTGTDAIASNEATLANTTGDLHEKLGSTSSTDEDGTVNFSLSASGINAGLELRMTDDNNYYRLVCSTTAISIIKKLSGTPTTLATASVTLTTGATYTMRFRVAGSTPALLYGRVWAQGTLEPTTWNVTGADAGTTAIPLTLYGSKVASGTLSTAAQLASGTGGTEAQSAINKAASAATGYMEITPLGGTQTINASLPSTPSGNGWLWDVTTLEGQQLNTGNYQWNIGLADLYFADSNVTLVWRAWKRSSGGSYTSIGSITLSSQAVNRTRTNFVFGPSSFSSMSFSTGDKLYLELYAGNITWRTGFTAQKYVVWISTSGVAGVNNDAMAGTAGYQTTGTGNIASGGYALMANGTGTTSFDHLRVTQYPDPSLSLSTVQRVGSTFFTWDATLAANTTLGMDVSGDGVNWYDMSQQNGGALPFINAMPTPTLDSFGADSSANYTSTSRISSQDTFTRPNQSGWGTASDGETYTHSGGTATYSIVSNQGQVTNDTNDNFQALGSTVYTDSDQRVRFTTTSNANGNWQGLFARYTATNAFYNAIVRSAGLFITKADSPLTSIPFTLATSTEYWIRFLIQGTTLSAKIWQDGTGEPTNWMVQVTDASYASGTAGAYSSPDNNATVTSFDSYSLSGLPATWTWDTTNNRLVATGGTNAILLWNTVGWFNNPVADIDLLCDLDQADAGGLVWQYQNAGNFYSLVVADASSNVGIANSATLYKVAGNVATQLTQASINFKRGTFHRFRVTMLAGAITITMDGISLLGYTDASPLGAGQVGLWNNGGAVGSRYYNLWVQPQGDYVGGTPFGDVVSAQFVYSRQRLATTDNTVTPQVLDLTIGVTDPNIGLGTLLPSVTYATTFISQNMDDLTSKSANYAWQIDQSTKLHFQTLQSIPAPWVLDSSDYQVQKLQVIYRADAYSNRQQLTNVISTIVFTDTKIGDSNSRSFALSYPNAAAPVITLNSQPQSVGVKGIDNNKNWYWQYGDPTIYQDANGTVMANTDTLSITGTGLTTTTVTRDALAAQATLQALEQTGTGIVEAITDCSQFGMNVAAAQVYGDQLNARYANLGRTVKFETTRTGLAPGQLIPGMIASRGILNAQLFITAVEVQARAVSTGKSSLTAQPRLFGGTIPGASGGPVAAAIRYVSIVEASETPYTGSWQRKLRKK